jgi:hypothetical protein
MPTHTSPLFTSADSAGPIDWNGIGRNGPGPAEEMERCTMNSTVFRHRADRQAIKTPVNTLDKVRTHRRHVQKFPV